MTLTLQEYAAAKRLPVEFLKSLGVSEHHSMQGVYVRIPYTDKKGAVVATRLRDALEGPARFRWKSGDKPQTYGQARLADARSQGFIVLVEGESDAQTLWLNGVPALGLPGTAWNESRDAPLLDGIETIYVVREPDQGGEAVMRWIARSAIKPRVRIMSLHPHKDVSALYLSAESEAFAPALKAAIAASVPFAEIEAGWRAAAAAEALGRARELANDPDILGRLAMSLKRVGVVGEIRNAKLIYLALTSRVLERPVSLAIKGVSSGGKSFVLDRVLDHFPPEASLRMSGMSPAALLYDERDYAHRHLVIAEGAGAEGEKQEYLIRTLLSEGRIEWQTVEKTSEGMMPRTIEKEGPTGLILTTTKLSLHPENETRLFSLTADDTREQTRRILMAVAESRERPPVEPVWPALQKWLAAGEVRVALPFVRALARLASSSAVRMRRDFTGVLALVKAHAILHQMNRARDAAGRIVATLDDYAAVHALTADLVAEGLQAGVSKAMRETVDAVAALAGETGVSVKAIAAALRVDRPAASRRCAAAARAGYIVNNEEKRNQLARYRVAEAMPDDAASLPAPAALREAMGEGGGITHAGHTGTTAQQPAATCRVVGVQAEDRPPSLPQAPPNGAARAYKWSTTI